MSVPSWKRNESAVQYVDTARELYEHTLRYCRKFPKSATFLVTKDVVDAAKGVFTNVLAANRIYPKTEGDRAQRRAKLFDALGGLAALDAIIPIAKDIFGLKDVSDYGWAHWGELIVKEGNLIKKVMASDERIAPT